MRRPTHSHLAGAALACTVLLTAGAAAQTFAGGPVGTLVLPGDPAVPPREGTGETVASSLASGLRHLPAHPNGLRLSGEAAFLEWPLTVTAAEARAGGTFRVAVTSAVSVLPQSASLSLTLNDVPAGRAPLRGTGRPEGLTFAVAPGALVPGVNAVRLAVSQRHRVDCSADATHELWTQIDPDATGFVPAAGTAADPTSLAEIAATPLDRDGTLPIRVVLAEPRLSPPAVERVLGAVQAVALAGRSAPASVDFGPPADGIGLDLAIGPRAALEAVLGPLPTPGPAGLAPRRSGHRPTLFVTGETEAALDAAVAGLADLGRLAPQGSDAGRRAALNLPGRPVEGGERLTLADFGVASAAFDGRVLRLGLNLVLPSDFVSADYDRAILDLAGGYARGLDPRAQIAVEVDGVGVASLGLGRPEGEAFRHNRIVVPLSRLRPGLNRLAITAIVPRRGEGLCEAEAAREAEGQKRLLLLADTVLELPALARATRLPDLAHAAAGFPDGRPVLEVPAPDRITMGAAATLVARLAGASGRIVPFAFATTPASVGPRLVVAPAPGLDPTLLAAVGLDPAALRSAWSARPLAGPREEPGREAARRRRLARDGIGACSGVPVRVPVPPRPAAEPARQPDPLERWTAEAGQRAPGAAWAWARAAFDAAWTGLTALLVPDDAAASDRGALADASLALGQGFAGAGAESLVTVVTAVDSEGLAEGVRCLTQPRLWNAMRGGTVLLAGDTLSARPPAAGTERWIARGPGGLGNLRRLGAAWFSLHPLAYGALGLLGAAALALSTHRLVRQLGRRSS